MQIILVDTAQWEMFVLYNSYMKKCITLSWVINEF